MENYISTDGWVLLVPKKPSDIKFKNLNGGHIFQEHSTSNIDARKLIQQSMRNRLPTVTAGYVVPLNYSWETILQWSDKLNIGKACGGKWPETPLVQCLADSYARIESKTLDIIKDIVAANEISNKEIFTLLKWDSEITEHVSDVVIDYWADIITSDYHSNDVISKIQWLAQFADAKPLLSYRLSLDTKQTRDSIMKTLWVQESRFDKIINKSSFDTYQETLLFDPETHRQATIREMKEESWFTLDPNKLIHYYTLSEIKSTEQWHNWLKHRKYYTYLDDLGYQWTTKFSRSEKKQKLNLMRMPLQDAISKQEYWIKYKMKHWEWKKYSTAIANWMAFQELNDQINSRKIQL